MDIIQLFHTFLCNGQNYYPEGAVDDPMHCCPRHRGGIVLTVAQKGMKYYYPTHYNIKYQLHNADIDACASHLHNNGGYEVSFGYFKLPITSLFVARNIKCRYSFS